MRTITVTVEVYDNSTIEEVEKAIDKGLNSKSIDCTYNIEEK